MNPSSTQATVGSAYFKAPPPREQSASQETLLEYLGIKPASSVGGDSYVEEPPYVVVPNKDFNGAYQTPYKDSKELEEVCEGDVPFVECRVEIQDGGEPGAKPPPEHNDYNYKVKEERKRREEEELEAGDRNEEVLVMKIKTLNKSK